MAEPKPLPLHIGIVACSAEGAALCYRLIFSEGARLHGPYAYPEVSVHTPSFTKYEKCLERHDWEGVGGLMLESAKKLAAMGADFLICPDNTIHQAFPLIQPYLPRPWLHIAQVVAEEAAHRRYRRVGLTGTRWLVESQVYPQALAKRGVEFDHPDADERDTIHRIIMEELVRGVLKRTSLAYFQNVIRRMRDRGCEAVILGCTEIPLLVNDGNSPLAVLDSTKLLAIAAMRRALGGA